MTVDSLIIQILVEAEVVEKHIFPHSTYAFSSSTYWAPTQNDSLYNVLLDGTWPKTTKLLTFYTES